MQSYTEIQSSQSLQASLRLLLENDKTAISCHSGSAFPTSGRLEGMLCYRTDQQKLYILKDLTPTWALLLNLSGSDRAMVEEVIFGTIVKRSVGNDGGALKFERPESGTTLAGNVDLRLKGDRLEVRDSFSGKGFHIDLAQGIDGAAGKVWTDQNHGAGSGLDADTLDGRQSGNASGNIPINNDALNVGLNAELFNGRKDSHFAPIASPLFTGTPAAPTPALGTNSTQLATTAFVQQALGTVALTSRVSKSGDTMTGNLTISTGAIYLRGFGGNNNAAVLYLNASNNRYLQFDGSRYNLPGAELFVNGQRVLKQTSAARVNLPFTSYEQYNTTRLGGGAGWGAYRVIWNDAAMSMVRQRIYYTNCANCTNCNCDCSNF